MLTKKEKRLFLSAALVQLAIRVGSSYTEHRDAAITFIQTVPKGDSRGPIHFFLSQLHSDLLIGQNFVTLYHRSYFVFTSRTTVALPPNLIAFQKNSWLFPPCFKQQTPIRPKLKENTAKWSSAIALCSIHLDNMKAANAAFKKTLFQ